jgi:PleD family two-component response regulator
MSLGVALAAPGESAESVMHRADQAMYRAKAEQRITFAA